MFIVQPFPKNMRSKKVNVMKGFRKVRSFRLILKMGILYSIQCGGINVILKMGILYSIQCGGMNVYEPRMI